MALKKPGKNKEAAAEEIAEEVEIEETLEVEPEPEPEPQPEPEPKPKKVSKAKDPRAVPKAKSKKGKIYMNTAPFTMICPEHGTVFRSNVPVILEHPSRWVNVQIDYGLIEERK